MSIIVDGVEYLDIKESREFLGVTDQTLRVLTKKRNIKRYHQDIASNKKYYKKTDLESLKAMKPVEEGDEDDEESEPASLSIS